MSQTEFCFTKDKFSKLFPFYIVVNKQMIVESLGKSLIKAISGINTGCIFSDFFIIKRPHVENLNYKSLVDNVDQLIVLESKIDGLLFRGQFECLDDTILFIGTPWFESMKQLNERELTLHDFALNDPLLDLLHVLNNQEITAGELKESLVKVSEQKNKFIESENRLATLIKNLQTAVLLESQDRKIVLTNNKFCAMFGFEVSPDKLKGADCANSAEDTKHFFKNSDMFVLRINEILDNKQVVLSEEIELVDGRVLERSYIPIVSDGSYKGHLWSYDDVTLKKRYEVNLENEKEKYRKIIANMKLGLVEINEKNEIILANQSFCDITGYELDELIGYDASTFLLTEASKKTVVEKRALRNQGLSDSYEIEGVDKNNNKKHWFVSSAPNYESNGIANGAIGILLDITEKKNLEIEQQTLLKALENKNERLNEYAQIISHDLKSPLRSIHTLVDWIKEENKTVFDSNTSNYFEMLQSKIENMDYLIDGVLSYSRIDEVEFVTEQVNLNEVVQNCISMIHVSKHINIKIDNELPCLKAEKYRLQQLFQNLITNAVNFIDKPQGHIKIASKEYNEYYVFSIEDNGIGIAQENHEKIFQTFQKFTKRERSTGLGLAIVKKIVDYYKGEIWLESSLNKGTTFYIKLNKT